MITSIAVFLMPDGTRDIVADAGSSRFVEFSNGAETVDRHEPNRMYETTAKQAIRDAVFESALTSPACPASVTTRVLVQACVNKVGQGLGTTIAPVGSGWDFRTATVCGPWTSLEITLASSSHVCNSGKATCTAPAPPSPPGPLLQQLVGHDAHMPSAVLGEARAVGSCPAPSAQSLSPDHTALTLLFEGLAIELSSADAPASAAAGTTLAIPVKVDRTHGGLDLFLQIDVRGFVTIPPGGSGVISIGAGSTTATESFAGDDVVRTEFCWRITRPMPSADELLLPILVAGSRTSSSDACVVLIDSIDISTTTASTATAVSFEGDETSVPA
jgi:hypothetical protein